MYNGEGGTCIVRGSSSHNFPKINLHERINDCPPLLSDLVYSPIIPPKTWFYFYIKKGILNAKYTFLIKITPIAMIIRPRNRNNWKNVDFDML